MKTYLLSAGLFLFSLGAADISFVTGSMPLETIPQTTARHHPSDAEFDAGLQKSWKTKEGITVISLLAGEKELHIRAEIQLGRRPTAATKKHDARFTEEDDAITFYFDPNLMNHSHRFIGVNCINVRNDGINNSYRRNYNIRTKTEVTEKGWRLYLAVPYTDLGILKERGSVFGLNVRQKESLLAGSLRTPAEWLPLSAHYPKAQLHLNSRNGFLNIISDRLKHGAILYDSVNGLQKVTFPFTNGAGKVKFNDKNSPGKISLIFIGTDHCGKRYSNRLYAEYYVDVYKGQPAGKKVSSSPAATIWTTSSMRKIMPDQPPPSKQGKSLEVALARNEYEGLPVHITPHNKMQEFKISFSQLKTKEGMVFPHNGINLFHLATVHISRLSDTTGHTGEWQDPLIPLETGKLNCPANRNTTLYLRIHAEKTVKAGIYEGKLHLDSVGEKISIPLKIRVYDFKLADRNHTQTAYGCFRRFPAYLGLKSREQRKEYMLTVCREMARYRISGGNVLSFLKIHDPYGTPDFSELDERIRYMTEELHFTGLNLASLINWELPRELCFRYGQKYTADEMETRKVFFEKLLTHLSEKNTLKWFYWYEIDEPNPGTHSKVAKYMDTVAELFPNVPRLTALNTQAQPELEGKSEIWAPILDVYNTRQPWWRKQQKQGRNIWWYVCNFPRYPYPTNFIDAPAIMPRIRAWIAEKFEIEGELYWSVDYLTAKDKGYESPYENPYIGNFSNGEGLLFWPPSFNAAQKPVFKAPWPSLRLEMIRDGIEDREYFYEAKECLRRLKRMSAADTVLITELENAVKIPDTLVKSPTSYTFSPRQLLFFRRKLATLIVRAQHELKKSSSSKE